MKERHEKENQQQQQKQQQWEELGEPKEGNSMFIKAISGIQTMRFKNELECNITIKHGYANAKIYKGENTDHDDLNLLYDNICDDIITTTASIVIIVIHDDLSFLVHSNAARVLRHRLTKLADSLAL